MGVMSSAEHVTFKGEYQDCCLVHIRTIRVWVYLNHGQFIGFENLHLAAGSDIYTWTRFIVVNNTNGLTFSNVHLQGGSIHFINSYIEIWNCSFNYTNMKLESVAPEIIDENTRLSINYNKTHFKDSIIFITIASEETAVIAMHGCTLKRSKLEYEANSFFSYPELKMNQCIVKYSTVTTVVYSLLNFSALININVTENNFTNSDLNFQLTNNEVFNTVSPKSVAIIEKNNFLLCKFEFYYSEVSIKTLKVTNNNLTSTSISIHFVNDYINGSIPYDMTGSERNITVQIVECFFRNSTMEILGDGHGDWLTDGYGALNFQPGRKILTAAVAIHNCTFVGDNHQSTALTIRFLSIPILLSETKIVNYSTAAIMCEYAMIHFKEKNWIDNNGNRETLPNFYDLEIFIGSSFGSIFLETSVILIQQNSKLQISNNYNGVGYDWFNMFPLQGTCPLFLVNSSLELLNIYEMENEFNGSIEFTNNTIFRGEGNQIFNGYLSKCLPETSNNTAAIPNITTLKDILHLPSWTSRDISSPPHKLCLCNDSDLGNRQLWDCNEYTNFTIYGGLDFTIYITLIGDLNLAVNDFVDLSYKIGINSYDRSNRLHVHGECYPMQFDGQIYRGSEASLSIRNGNEHLKTVQVNFYECPLGFKQHSLNTSLSPTCLCDDFLNDHGFSCTISYSGFKFQQNRDDYWIHYDLDTLTFSDHCPSFFCNNQLKEKGIVFKSSNLSPAQQCNGDNNRLGILCSECPPGHSSTFGGQRCRCCKNLWYLMLLLVGGFDLLVLFLFLLFNFTIVYQTTIGIALYANVLYMYDDFFLKHSRHFAYKFIATLNLRFSYENCFFNEMNEYSKHLIKFCGPFSLIFLIALIIFSANKLKLKVFKFSLISERAVPVLATLMIITYYFIIGNVCDSLRSTTIYTLSQNESITETKHWLYQPALKYFEMKHLGLAMFALLLTLLYALPLTVIVLFGDILKRKLIRFIWFSHFIDAFYAPYRWPFGFWLGVRLLLRIILVIPRGMLSEHRYALFVAFVMIIFLAVQTYIKPFHSGRSHHDESKDNDQHHKSLWRKRMNKIIKWYTNPLFLDGLLQLNAILVSIAISSRLPQHLNTVACVLSATFAGIHITLIFAYHGYMFFPIPKCIKRKWKSFKQKLPRLKSQKDNDCSNEIDSVENIPFRYLDFNEADTSKERDILELDRSTLFDGSPRVIFRYYFMHANRNSNTYTCNMYNMIS